MFVLIASIVALPAFQCNKENTRCHPAAGECFKGKLEIAGICRNYTIKLLEGNIDRSRIEASWTDPTTNKTYQDVFGLGSLCSFPADIQVGEEFYFTITDQADKDCATCMAYYPTPNKKLFISVKKEGCQNSR